MKNHISRSFIARILFLLAIPTVLGMAGQLVGAQAGGYNLFKEVMAKKDTIVWKNDIDDGERSHSVEDNTSSCGLVAELQKRVVSIRHCCRHHVGRLPVACGIGRCLIG